MRNPSENVLGTPRWNVTSTVNDSFHSDRSLTNTFFHFFQIYLFVHCENSQNHLFELEEIVNDSLDDYLSNVKF